MRRGDRIVFRAPETRRVIFAANFRDFAVFAVVAWLHKKSAGLDAGNKLSDGFFNFLSYFASESHRAE